MAPATPAPDPALVGLCETIERQAFGEQFAHAPAGFAADLGLARLDVAGAMAIASKGAPRRMYNHVFSLGLEGAPDDATLERIEAFHRRAGAAAFVIAPPPSAAHDALAARLAARGHARGMRWLKLARRVGEPPRVPAPRGLGVRELATRADAEAFGLLVVAGFPHAAGADALFASVPGRPRWRVFAAFDGATLVAGGALYVRDGVGWLGTAVTRESHRRRGAQTALIAARMTAARDAGAEWLTVETTDDTPERPNPSTHNLRRLGFEDAYARHEWLKVLHEVPGATR